MKKKPFILAAIAAAVASLAVWGFIEGRKELALEAERERPVQVPSRVVAQPDGTALVFDADTQKRADIAVAPVKAVTRSGEVEALAAVLSAQELIDLRSAFITARVQADRAQAAAQASRREYERIKALHSDDYNASTKALEAAQAQQLAEEAAVRGADEIVAALERGIRQKWGGVLAAAVLSNASSFQRLTDGREVLLRVAALAGTALVKAPPEARVTGSDGGFRVATLVSSSPMADPRIQGPTFFYTAPPDGLLAGTTVTAYLPSGAERTGGLIPADAVVLWQGKAWYYVQGAPDRFLRRELTGAMPVDQGWFVAGLPALQVVVRGAQTLLSEELRSQIEVGEESK
ncbi:multidrug transporter [Duganella sp. FT3S]|uniref:Multidrug transporter n=1 Tax=Rugamonas fusca TaxID=2758568 RepID=A0A7W2EEG8_9BURK|nr:multidrug transporter [Rugamonas fusca]MBA5604287.1 multidrug transporter [Rugamonas fusca]